MWVYRIRQEATFEAGRKSGMKTVYDVGYYYPFEVQGLDDNLLVLETWETRTEAREAVNYLNGGNSEVRVDGVIVVDKE